MPERWMLEELNRGKALTAPELKVLQLVSNGYTNAEIGDLLHKSEFTIKAQLRNLRAKLEADNTAHAIAIGFRKGVIE